MTPADVLHFRLHIVSAAESERLRRTVNVLLVTVGIRPLALARAAGLRTRELLAWARQSPDRPMVISKPAHDRLQAHTDWVVAEFRRCAEAVPDTP